MSTKRYLTFLPLLSALFLIVVATSASVTAQTALTPKEQLGKSIFFDQHLSLNQNQACAACHAPGVGWTGPTQEINAGGGVYEGSIAGRFGDRKPPSSGYATMSPVLAYEMIDGEALFSGGNFWDGRATGEKLGSPAADQAQGPFLNPMEQALPDSACVVYRVCNPVTAADYPASFASVWGADACVISWPADTASVCSQEGTKVALSDADRTKSNSAYDSIALSIAVYEGSSDVNRFSSKFDAYVAKRVKLSKEELAGYKLFDGKAQCSACHVLTDKNKKADGSLFTDFTYDNIGVPRNPENPIYNRIPDFVDKGLGGFLARRTDYAQFAAANMGKHKVTTLRNVALRPSSDIVKAYTHNGYFKTLEGLVHFYNTRDVLARCPGYYTEAEALAANCWPAPEVVENLNTAEVGNLQLSASEEASIVAFLKTLSDGYVVEGRSADLQSSTAYLPLITR